METKHLEVSIEKASSDEYDARFVMSASTPDRVKDTIDPEAYKSNLGKKLIALYQHNPDQPLGFWNNLRVESGKLIGDLKVASTNLGMMVKQLIADGVPLGASIGFRGKGEANKIGGIHFKEIELFECSVVSIPAHPRAMQIAKSFDCEKFLGAQSSGADGAGNSAHSRDRAAVILKAKSVILTANKSLR
jgi:HK97 family phage prohead protease